MDPIRLPPYAYFALMLASRLAFGHRDCVRAAGSGRAPGGKRWKGALLCLLPLALMQLGPFVEYLLRCRRLVGPAPAGNGFFALMGPGEAAAGLMLFAAGTVLAARASRELARAWGRAPGELYTGGLYAIIRHPLYAAYLVQGAGCCLMLGAVWSWAAWGLAVLLVLARVAVEDRELAGRFGAFEAYSRRVKRLVPGAF